jgi:hypothetical protein
MNKDIACDLTVFSSEKRISHEEQSLSLIKNSRKIIELKDGYSFYHDYSDETFTSIARWITGERKCCPFFTFELALEPAEKGYEIALRLRGSEEIKQFLKSGFQGRGIKIA